MPIDTRAKTYFEGSVLVHEHVICRTRNQNREAVRLFLQDQLVALADRGVVAIVDVTPYASAAPYADIILDAPVTVLTSAGFYLERRVHPSDRVASEGELERRLYRRATSKRHRLSPAVLKVATGRPPFTTFEKRALRVVARVAASTGQPIVTHAVHGAAEQFRTLVANGADPARILLSHPEMGLKGRNPRSYADLTNELVDLCAAGANLCFTDLSPGRTRYANEARQLLRDLIDHGFARRLFVSGDTSWRVSGGRVVANGGRGNKARQAFSYTPSELAPWLLQHNVVTSTEWSTMLVDNPRELLGVSLGARRMNQHGTPTVSQFDTTRKPTRS